MENLFYYKKVTLVKSFFESNFLQKKKKKHDQRSFFVKNRF